MQNNIEYLLKELFNVHRGLSGYGNFKTLCTLERFLPSLNITSWKVGKRYSNWKIPQEWNVEEAWIVSNSGKKIVDIKDSYLHILQNSLSVNLQNIDYETLIQHLYYLKDKPKAIPYRTSYYKPEWGFCITYETFKSLDPNEKYDVYINSSFKAAEKGGRMYYATDAIQNKLKDELLISSYICHPNLANDNLSGIICATLLFSELKKLKLNRSYRFLLAPETIGMLAYLHTNKIKHIKNSLIFTCLGGPDNFSYKQSFLGNSEIDRLIKLIPEIKKIYQFEPIGSDERQLSNIGYRIPSSSIHKSKYYEYAEYHTSDDNLNFVSAKNIHESINLHLKLIQLYDENVIYKRVDQFKGEIMLSGYGLYPNTGGAVEQKTFNQKLHIIEEDIDITDTKLINWLLFEIDGKTSLLDICEKRNLNYLKSIELCKLMLDKKIIKTC